MRKKMPRSVMQGPMFRKIFRHFLRETAVPLASVSWKSNVSTKFPATSSGTVNVVGWCQLSAGRISSISFSSEAPPFRARYASSSFENVRYAQILAFSSVNTSIDSMSPNFSNVSRIHCSSIDYIGHTQNQCEGNWRWERLRRKKCFVLTFTCSLNCRNNFLTIAYSLLSKSTEFSRNSHRSSFEINGIFSFSETLFDYLSKVCTVSTKIFMTSTSLKTFHSLNQQVIQMVSDHLKWTISKSINLLR